MRPLRFTTRMSENVDISLKLWVVLNRAVGSISDRLRRQVEAHGISFTEFAVLEVLYNKKLLPLGAIGEKVLLTSGSMTYVVDKLEQRGLLRRKDCPEDRRVVYAELTEDGMQLMDRVFPEHAAAIEATMAGLTPAERSQVTELIKRLGLYAKQQAVPM